MLGSEEPGRIAGALRKRPLPWSSLFIKQNSISSLPDTRNQCYKHTCITIICLQKNPSENLLETRKIGQPKAHRQGKSSLLDLPQSISAWGVISSSSPHPAQQTSTSKSWRLNWALTCKISKKARHATSLHLLVSRQSISTLDFLPHTQKHQRHPREWCLLCQELVPNKPITKFCRVRSINCMRPNKMIMMRMKR